MGLISPPSVIGKFGIVRSAFKANMQCHNKNTNRGRALEDCSSDVAMIPGNQPVTGHRICLAFKALIKA